MILQYCGSFPQTPCYALRSGTNAEELHPGSCHYGGPEDGADSYPEEGAADHAKPSTTMDVYRHLFDQKMVDAMGAAEASLGL